MHTSWKHTYLACGTDRLKIGLRIDEAFVREREKEGEGFNYPRVHYFPRGGPIPKDPEGDRKGEGGRCRGQSTSLRLRRRNYKSFPFNVN